MDYEFSIGNKKTVITDPLNYIVLDYDFFTPLTTNSGDYVCSIQSLEDHKNEKPLSFFLKPKSRKLDIKGFYQDKYISVLTNRNIFIITDIERRHIQVYCNKDSINEKSIYMFFCTLKKHIIRLLFADRVIPLHAACVYNKNINKAILIVGESNSGKSSICWQLQNLGFQCIADDLVLYSNDFIHTAIEYLYITKDFVDRFQLNDAKSVCAGRKYRITVTPQLNSFPINNCAIILTHGINEQKRLDVLTNKESIAKKIGVVHRQWSQNYTEYQTFSKGIESIISKIDNVFQLYLNNSLVANLSEIIEKLS